MSALEQTWSRVRFDEPATVERWLVQGSVAGAFAAGLATLLSSMSHSREPRGFAVAFAAAALMLVLPRKTLGMRLALLGAAMALPVFLPWNLTVLPFFFTVPLGLVLAQEPGTPARKILAALGPSLGAAWCALVERWLSARHLGAPAAWLSLLWAGLFISAGASLAWVRVAADAMEPRLDAQPKVLASWLRLRAALGRLPKGSPRTELERLALEGADRCVSVHAEKEQAVSALDETAEQEAREAVTTLRERMDRTSDPELKAHLAQLTRVHQDTLEQVDGLRRRVERLDARVAVAAGWLETAAFSVELGPRTELGVRDLAARLEKLLRP